MDTSEITRLHGLCVEGLRAYIQKAKNTCALLESMTSFPPSRETWLKALEQRLTENEAHGRYQTAREHLFEALRPMME